MEDLFRQSAEVVGKRKRRSDEDDDAPVLVSDGNQIKRLIVEAVGELVDGEAEYTRMSLEQMKAAGYRPWVDSSESAGLNHWVVDQVVKSGLSEPQFKAMVKYALNPKESGTGAFGLVHREPNGDWAIAAVQVRDGSVVKLDHKRERGRGIATGGDGIEWDPSAPPPSDFVGIRKPTVEWAVVFVDRNKASPVRRDMHGRELPVAEVKVDTGGERLAAVLERMVGGGSPGSPGEAVAPVAAPAASAPSASFTAKKRDRRSRAERAAAAAKAEKGTAEKKD